MNARVIVLALLCIGGAPAQAGALYDKWNEAFEGGEPAYLVDFPNEAESSGFKCYQLLKPQDRNLVPLKSTPTRIDLRYEDGSFDGIAFVADSASIEDSILAAESADRKKIFAYLNQTSPTEQTPQGVRQEFPIEGGACKALWKMTDTALIAQASCSVGKMKHQGLVVCEGAKALPAKKNPWDFSTIDRKAWREDCGGKFYVRIEGGSRMFSCLKPGKTYDLAQIRCANRQPYEDNGRVYDFCKNPEPEYVTMSGSPHCRYEGGGMYFCP